MPPEECIHFAYVLDGKGGASPMDGPALSRWSPDQGVQWVLFDRFHQGTAEWLSDVAGLPDLVCESLMAEDTRPRVVSRPEGLLVILRGVNVNPGAEPDAMVSVRMWIDEHRVISLRGPHVFALDDIVDRLQRSVGPRTPGELLVLLSDALADRMRDVVSNQEDLVGDIEEALLERPGPELRRRLATPRRQSMTIRRYLAPQRDTTARLTTEPTPLLTDRDRMRLREVADELTRLVEELDLLRDRSTMIQEQIASQMAEQMNRTMYVLSLVAAIFLPLGLITGLLGINVGGVPLSSSSWGFWVVTGMLVVLAVVQTIWFRRMRWM